MEDKRITGVKVYTEEHYEFDPAYFSNGRIFVAKHYNNDGTLHLEGLVIIVMNSDKSRKLHFNFYRKFPDGAVGVDAKEMVINGDVVADGTWQFTPVDIFDKEEGPKPEAMDPSDTINEFQAKIARFCYKYKLDELEPAKQRAEIAEREKADLTERLRDTQGKRGDFLEKLCEALGIDKMPPFWDEAEEAVLKAVKELKEVKS